MYLNATDLRYLLVPVYGAPGVDLTGFPVDMAIVTEDAGEPSHTSAAWQSATWATGQRARLLVDAATFTPGAYMVWVRVTAPPEEPVITSGRLRIGAL